MSDEKPYGRKIEAVLPRTVFDIETGTVSGWLDTFYRGDNGGLRAIDSLEIDPKVLVLEYQSRCLAVQNRNPDMPKRQAVEIALLQWALALSEWR